MNARLLQSLGWICKSNIIWGGNFDPFIYKWVNLGYVSSLMGKIKI